MEDMHRTKTDTLEGTVMNGLGDLAGTVKKALGFETNSAPLKSSQTSPSAATNFDKVVETSTSYDGIDVSLYKSRETGLKVLIANVEIPLVCSSAGFVDDRSMGISRWLQRFGMIVGVLMYFLSWGGLMSRPWSI